MENISSLIKYEILNYFSGGLAYPQTTLNQAMPRGLNYRNVFFARLSTTLVNTDGTGWTELVGGGYSPQLLNLYDHTKSYGCGRYLNPFRTGVGSAAGRNVTQILFVNSDVNFGPAEEEWDQPVVQVGIWCGPPSWDLPAGVHSTSAGDKTVLPSHFFGGFTMGHVTIIKGQRIRFQAPVVDEFTITNLKGIYFRWATGLNGVDPAFNEMTNGFTSYSAVVCAEDVDIGYENFGGAVQRPSDISLGAYLGDGNLGCESFPIQAIGSVWKSRLWSQEYLPWPNLDYSYCPPYVRFTLRWDKPDYGWWEAHPDLPPAEENFGGCSFGARLCSAVGAYAVMWTVSKETEDDWPTLSNAPYLTFPSYGYILPGIPLSLGIGYYYWSSVFGFDTQMGLFWLRVYSPETFVIYDTPVILSGDCTLAFRG